MFLMQFCLRMDVVKFLKTNLSDTSPQYACIDFIKLF